MTDPTRAVWKRAFKGIVRPLELAALAKVAESNRVKAQTTHYGRPTKAQRP